MTATDSQERSLTAGSAPIQRVEGVTPAERYLSYLCDRSFLSLWSYAGVYRDQGNAQ